MREYPFDMHTIHAVFEMMGAVEFYFCTDLGLWLAVDLTTPGLDPYADYHVWRCDQQAQQVEFLALDNDEYRATVVHSPTWHVADPEVAFARVRPLFMAALRGHGLTREELGPLGRELISEEIWR